MAHLRIMLKKEEKKTEERVKGKVKEVKKKE